MADFLIFIIQAAVIQPIMGKENDEYNCLPEDKFYALRGDRTWITLANPIDWTGFFTSS